MRIKSNKYPIQSLKRYKRSGGLDTTCLSYTVVRTLELVCYLSVAICSLPICLSQHALACYCTLALRYSMFTVSLLFFPIQSTSAPPPLLLPDRISNNIKLYNSRVAWSRFSIVSQLDYLHAGHEAAGIGGANMRAAERLIAAAASFLERLPTWQC